MAPIAIVVNARCQVGMLFVFSTYVKHGKDEKSARTAGGCHAAMLLAIPAECAHKVRYLAEGARKLPDLNAELIGLAAGGDPLEAQRALIDLAKARLSSDQSPTCLVEYSVSLEHFLATARSHSRQLVERGALELEVNAILARVHSALADSRSPKIQSASRFTGAVMLLIGRLWQSTLRS